MEFAQTKLDMLDKAKRLEDLRVPPNNRLEKPQEISQAIIVFELMINIGLFSYGKKNHLVHET